MNTEQRPNFLDGVAAVAENDAEVWATLRHLLETGHVQSEAVAIDTVPWAA